MTPDQTHFAKLLSEQVDKAVAKAVAETKEKIIALLNTHQAPIHRMGRIEDLAIRIWKDSAIEAIRAME